MNLKLEKLLSAGLGAFIGGILIADGAVHAYVSPQEKVCNTPSCGMTVGGFADRMSRATGAEISFSEYRDRECRMSKYIGGYYLPAKHKIVLCNENANSVRSIVRTLSHEVAHAYQACTNGPYPIRDYYPNQAANNLSQAEIDHVKKSYPKSQHWMEFNARTISNIIANEDLMRGADLQTHVDMKCGDVKRAMRSLGSVGEIRKLH